VEVAERPRGRDPVAGLQAEDVGRTHAGRAVLARRRRGDAHVEAQEWLEPLVARQGVVVAAAALRVVRDQVEYVLGLPDRCIGLGDVEVPEADGFVRGDFNLQVVAGGEGDGVGGADGLQD